MPLAPQYWISQADRLRTEDVPAVLNGFLTERADYRLAEMLHGRMSPPSDMTTGLHSSARCAAISDLPYSTHEGEAVRLFGSLATLDTPSLAALLHTKTLINPLQNVARAKFDALKKGSA